jgi:uncharacterized protein YkwD
MTLTAAEQYLIELINRARLDPGAEAKRYGLDLNADVTQHRITTAAEQVLAPDQTLEKAAVAHSDWMPQAKTFSHTSVQNSDPGARMAKARYEFTGSTLGMKIWLGRVRRLISACKTQSRSIMKACIAAQDTG